MCTMQPADTAFDWPHEGYQYPIKVGAIDAAALGPFVK